MKALILFLAALALHPSLSFATPAQVLLIRHAEKPEDDNEPNLSARGKERAEALVSVFTSNPAMLEFGKPVAIYAAKPKEGGSVRSIETVTPLAKHLGVEVRAEYMADEVKDAAKEILKKRSYDGKTVLIAWPNDEIPKFARKLGAEDAPKDWKKKVFDRVWKLTFSADGSVQFANIPQKALPGDSN